MLFFLMLFSTVIYSTLLPTDTGIRPGTPQGVFSSLLPSFLTSSYEEVVDHVYNYADQNKKTIVVTGLSAGIAHYFFGKTTASVIAALAVGGTVTKYWVSDEIRELRQDILTLRKDQTNLKQENVSLWAALKKQNAEQIAFNQELLTKVETLNKEILVQIASSNAENKELLQNQFNTVYRKLLALQRTAKRTNDNVSKQGLHTRTINRALVKAGTEIGKISNESAEQTEQIKEIATELHALQKALPESTNLIISTVREVLAKRSEASIASSPLGIYSFSHKPSIIEPLVRTANQED